MVIAEDAGIRQRIVADARALALKYLQQPPVTVVNKYIVNAATNSAAVVPESTKLQQQSQHPTPIEKPIPQHTSVPSTCASSSSSSSSSLLLSSKCLDTAVLKRKLEALADSAEAAAAEMDQTNPRKHEARSVIPVISTAAASLNNNRRSSMSDLVTGPANSSSLNEVHLSLSSSSGRNYWATRKDLVYS